MALLMFDELGRRTLDLLTEKTANWPFLGDATDEVGEENEYNEAEGVVRLLQPDTLQAMKLADQRESEMVDERGTEEFGREMFLLGDGEAFGGQRMAQLRKCRQRLQKLTEQHEKCDRIVHELGDKYQSVAEKTSSLHNDCDRMMSEQTQLATANEQIGANLHYYQRYEWLIKKLATPKLSLTGTLFTQILSSVHECLQYLRAHPEQREASSFIHKYEQCLSRSLTAVKAGVLSDLESCRQDVLYRQHRFSQSAAVHQSTTTALSFVDDDTFALLYGVFGVKANAIRNAFSQAHQFFADSAEYQTVVAECEHEYFAIRDQLLRPIVHSTIQTFCDQCQNSSCTLTRGGCTFLLRLCDDEFRLYRQFFVLGEADTRASMTPTTPASLLFSFWPAQPHSNQFDAFIEGLCRVLYDTLRPLIVHNPHLETLAQLCTLLKVEMIDESLFANRSNARKLMSELVADIVERIVYRTSLFAQSDILDYNPAPGDLVYPERVRSSGNNSDSPSSTSPIDQHCLWYPTVRRTVMCLSKLYRCLDATVFLNVSRELLDACCQSLERAVDRIRTLPIKPAHATLRSKSNRSLDAELFIIKHLLILREQTSPFRQHNKQQERSASSAPFLRQSSLNEAQINPQFDYSLDLSKYTQSMFQLLNVENRARWFEFGSNNAFLSLLLLSPIHVSELQTDSRRIIESHLKRWCHSMIGHVSGILLGPLAQFQTSIERLQAEQEQRAQEQKNPLDVNTSDRFSPRALHDCCADAFKRLKQQWPEVRAAFTLYIGVLETEEILLQPIRKSVSNAFNALNSFAERHYDTEQRQIISAPNQEQIWLILNATATSAIEIN
uniref:Conserved oligomeric Golgi complex subunit 3 n=1 Tax=Globodera rostochiensis TaxID=31243 RepID=A0A914HQ14_GLORO